MTRILPAAVLFAAAALPAALADEPVAGIVKSTDPTAGTVTLTTRGATDRADKTFTLAKDAKVVVNGQPKGLAAVPNGARATLTLDAQQKVTSLTARTADAGKERPTDRPGTPPGKTTPPVPPPARPGAGTAEERKAAYAKQQEFVFARWKEQQTTALAAAATRKAPAGPKREFYVNNETGDDAADGTAPAKAVRTLARAAALLKPGDTLHLAVTSQPYRETLRLGDGFGGVPGWPVVIEGHGATITGCDPLRLDGWEPAGAPGLYRSVRFLAELEEFTDEAKLMRVFLLFDGVIQHMGRSSKGMKAAFKAPAALQAGEWTYDAAEKAFYVRVAGTLADAKVSAPYRRNGLAVRAPKEAATHVVVKNLIVCHVLNDGFNLHGTTRDFVLKNIAAYECGDDGISPHDTCEVTIDGYWGVGNSTGMGNGNLSVTKARNVRLEGNTAHQFMTGHAPVTELTNAVIVAAKGTQPVNVTNAQATRTVFDNVVIASPAGQKVLNVTGGVIEGRRVTSVGPVWENAGTVRLTESVFGNAVTCPAGGEWAGSKNVFDTAVTPPGGEVMPRREAVTATAAWAPGQPFPGRGADAGEMRIPPRPVPHPAAGKFTTLARPSGE